MRNKEVGCVKQIGGSWKFNIKVQFDLQHNRHMEKTSGAGYSTLLLCVSTGLKTFSTEFKRTRFYFQFLLDNVIVHC